MSAGGLQTTWVDYGAELCMGCTGAGCECRSGCPARKELVKKGLNPDRVIEGPESEWKKPYRLPNDAWVLVCPSSDLFQDQALPFVPRVLDLVRDLPWLNFIILTKHPENAKDVLPEIPLPNLWIGTSAGTQKKLDERVRLLYEVPAVGYVISVQPLLEHLNLVEYLSNERLKLVVVGCEMGRNARPCDNKWIKSILNQCDCYGVDWFITRYRDEDGNLITLPTYNGRGSNEPSRPSFVSKKEKPLPNH